ncbi:vacuolar protein sorting-associated protein 8 homolog isoform X2 [Ceratina calcarata]|uniref:Vacuolar protein sorting-associated protein 8 homolog isoform X2 n=1 Tax=Ceratina calcarata TaxID=156304 RepID=A0AAJ7J624_9HYME|nr:vacuolar protein sorting-associated protein 8 homolog isoform X2 [Ceratina calcarata]
MVRPGSAAPRLGLGALFQPRRHQSASRLRQRSYPDDRQCERKSFTDAHRRPSRRHCRAARQNSPKVALCSDSGGSVFELNFTRVMGVRGCESRCLFSGSRGEVCTLEPLLLNYLPSHPLKTYTLVAMATLSKVIVVCIRPRMRVVLTHPLIGAPIAPPQLSWQLVMIQAADASRMIDPVLALARDDIVYFYQVCTESSSRVRLSPLRRMTLPYTISNLRWLNPRSLAVLDTQERLHLLDVRAQDNLETLDMSRVGISYASSHFKGLSTGGNVSKAMALAGERACYNTVVTFGTQLLLLGTKSLHVVCIRTWTERLRHLTMQRRYPEALALGLAFYQDKGKAVVGLRGSRERRKQIARDRVCQVLVQYMEEELNHHGSGDENQDQEIVSICVDYSIQLENTEFLFGKLWDSVSECEGLKASYLKALEGPLLDGSLKPRLPPLIAQQLVAFYDAEEKLEALQAIVVLLDVDCLDIHQVTTICRERGLWEALIHLQTTALGDFTAPIHQLVPVLQSGLTKDLPDRPSLGTIQLGNALLVYASCCLAGRGFPKDDLPENMSQRAKADVLRALLSQHSTCATDNERQYPYLRTLLRFDAKGFLDVMAIAFQEPEFTSEMGLRQRQRLVDILISIAMPNTPLAPGSDDALREDQRNLVLVFVANELAENTVSLEPAVLNRMVETLCWPGNEEARAERESAVLGLVAGRKLRNMADAVLLRLSEAANFYRVAEIVYSAREDWPQACRCMLEHPARSHDVWPWLNQLEQSSLRAVVLANCTRLLRLDSHRLASLIAAHLREQLKEVFDALDEARSKYDLLDALYICAGQSKEEESLGFELDTEMLETFLELMCQFQPQRVVSHVRGVHGCRPDEALRIVQRAEHRTAEAVVLEKLGNYQEAHEILSRELRDRMESYRKNEVNEEAVTRAAGQVAGLCRRAAGNLDWMPLIETILEAHSNGREERVEKLCGRLLRVVLEFLGGSTALSTVLEQILKHPLATSGTIGDIRQLLKGVLAHSRYEQTLVEATARLVSLELHEALKKSLRDAGRASGRVSIICHICRHLLSQCTNYVIAFNCGHGFHSECLGEAKSCYKCLNSKGWAPVVTHVTRLNSYHESKQLLEPEFMTRSRELTLRLAPPSLPDLEGIF